MTKVLLVEDDFSLRDIYSARFQAEGYNVVTAADGEEALATAVRERPDLIVLDVMMPKISGFDVLDILRSTPETQTTKVIMMTALSQEADRQRGETLGVNKYLIKSQVTLEDVVSTVKQVLSEGNVPATPNTPAPSAALEASQPAPSAAPVDPTVNAANEAPAPLPNPGQSPEPPVPGT